MNSSFLQNNVTNKNKSVQSDDTQLYLNDISKALFVKDNTSTKTPTIRKKVRRNFILSKYILSSRQDKNNTFSESIFVCSKYSNGDANNQHSSKINETSNNYNINHEENPTLPIDGTYTGNINSSNTLNNNKFEDELSSYQDNSKLSPNTNYDIEGYFCHNCHRNNTLDYFILYKVQLSSLNKKKKIISYLQIIVTTKMNTCFCAKNA